MLLTYLKKSGFTFLFFCPIIFATAQTKYTLKQAVQSAKSNNPNLKTAFYNIGISESNVVTAKLRPNPSLNNQTLQLLRSSLYPAGTHFYNNENRQVWWQLTKVIQSPAQRQYKIEVADKSVKLQQKQFSDLQRNLSFDVSNAWLNTWIIQNRLDLIDKARQNIDTLVKINENRLRNQVITQADLTRTQILSEQYELQSKTVKQDYNNALQGLKLLIGINDSISIETNSSVEVLPVSNQYDSLITAALTNRTDVQTAQGNIDVSKSNINLQKALKYPQPELGMIWNPQNSVPYIGFFGTVKLPFFDRNQGEIQKSKISQSQAEQNLLAVQLQVKNEIQTAYQTYQVRKQNLDRYQKIQQQSEQVLNTVRYSYLRGGTTIIDFLDAQRTWYDTRQLYFDALLSYHQSYIQLLFVTGLLSKIEE